MICLPTCLPSKPYQVRSLWVYSRLFLPLGDIVNPPAKPFYHAVVNDDCFLPSN